MSLTHGYLDKKWDSNSFLCDILPACGKTTVRSVCVSTAHCIEPVRRCSSRRPAAWHTTSLASQVNRLKLLWAAGGGEWPAKVSDRGGHVAAQELKHSHFHHTGRPQPAPRTLCVRRPHTPSSSRLAVKVVYLAASLGASQAVHASYTRYPSPPHPRPWCAALSVLCIHPIVDGRFSKRVRIRTQRDALEPMKPDSRRARMMGGVRARANGFPLLRLSAPALAPLWWQCVQVCMYVCVLCV